MLNKNEKLIMNIILDFCKKEKTVLLTYDDIVSRLKSKDFLSRKEVDAIVGNLKQAMYIDNIITDNKGDKYYCITLLDKGSGFIREQKDRKRVLWQRIGITAALAILSFAITMALKAIF